MSKSLQTILTFGSLVAILLLAVFISSIALPVQGSAPSGLPATQTYATTTTVGPDGDIDGTSVTIFSAVRNCSSRVVSTNDIIWLSFATPANVGDIASSTIASEVGFAQAASTTVVYDSGLYGCGRVSGYAIASTTLTVAEFN